MGGRESGAARTGEDARSLIISSSSSSCFCCCCSLGGVPSSVSSGVPSVGISIALRLLVLRRWTKGQGSDHQEAEEEEEGEDGEGVIARDWTCIGHMYCRWKSMKAGWRNSEEKEQCDV